MKFLLRLLQLPYLAVVTIDRLFFKLFPSLVYRPNARVVSIGNLSMGGTGKTPVLFALLNEILNTGIDVGVCVITRGYRSPWENSLYLLQGPGPHPEELTDEALLFNQRFEWLPLLIGKRRYRSARIGDRQYKPDLFLLDDGFQYRRLEKDYDIVLWDSHCQPWEAELIPFGRLREPISRLSDANAILLTRCESAAEKDVDFWCQWLARHAPGKKIVKMQTVCEGLFDVAGNQIEENPAEVIALSAIGRPASFYQLLEQLGIKVVHQTEFRDHHRFSAEEIEKLAALHRQSGLPVVCTEKDRVKLKQSDAEKLGLLTLRIRMQTLSGKALLEELPELAKLIFNP
ncbi:MAG: tetraacyldisaccharide 4'-kinase [Candidatus Riflebacteria bacterium]